MKNEIKILVSEEIEYKQTVAILELFGEHVEQIEFTDGTVGLYFSEETNSWWSTDIFFTEDNLRPVDLKKINLDSLFSVVTEDRVQTELQSRIAELEAREAKYREAVSKLIKMQENCSARYKACFGEQNPTGHQVFDLFVSQLKEILRANEALKEEK